jgi:hypothetical protein
MSQVFLLIECIGRYKQEVRLQMILGAKEERQKKKKQRELTYNLWIPDYRSSQQGEDIKHPTPT